MAYLFNYRVYYRDTDAAGVMYYARYGDLFEVGRMELFRSLGINIKNLHDQGLVFPIRKLEINYKKPAYLDDLLCLQVSLSYIGRSKVNFYYEVKKNVEQNGSNFVPADHSLITSGTTENVCVVAKDMKPVCLPKDIREKLMLAMPKIANFANS